MDNTYTEAEAMTVLEAMGAKRVTQHAGTIRCACPIHNGSNGQAFSSFRDTWGNIRFVCFTQHCCRGWGTEKVVSVVLQTTVSDAVRWIGELLGRTDLIVPQASGSELKVIVREHKPIILDDMPAIERLRGLYPHHAYWQGRGFTPEACAAYLLTYRSLDNRAVIPVTDVDRQLVGIQTRALDPTDPLKYHWDSPNSNKSAFLFGIAQAADLYSPTRPLFLVEGTLDVVKAWEAGYAAVASQGNTLSPEQARDILTRWDHVVVIPDNDGGAGDKLLDAVEKHLSPFVDVAVASLPEDIKDLDSFPTHNEVGDYLHNTIISWRNQWKTPRFRAFSRLPKNTSTSNP